MIIGAHSIIYSRNPDADRAFLRDVLKLPNIDVGDARPKAMTVKTAAKKR